jgi:glycosyltransferase involved in cell wall biosynthesis
MSVDSYDWPELRQLYRDSDVVVISLKAHNFQAGLTTLFESLACGRPVVMTRTPGLVEEFIDADVVTGVEPYDSAGMREAVLYLLSNPQEAEAQTERGYQLVRQSYNSEQFVDSLATQLASLQ